MTNPTFTLTVSKPIVDKLIENLSSHLTQNSDGTWHFSAYMGMAQADFEYANGVLSVKVTHGPADKIQAKLTEAIATMRQG